VIAELRGRERDGLVVLRRRQLEQLRAHAKP
jgi:hypothetical protein